MPLLLPPDVEVPLRHDVGRDAGVEEGEQVVLADEQIPAPGAFLDLGQLGAQRGVVADEVVLGLPITLDERVAQEQLARLLRVDGRVPHAAPGHERQAVERHPLEGHRRTPLGVPVRLAVGALDQVPRDPLDRLGLDARGDPAEQPARLDEIGDHHPARRAPGQRRPGGEDEAGVPCANILSGISVTGADVAEQAGQQRGVHARRVGRIVALNDVEPARDRAQLTDEVLPLADAQVVQELLAAHAAELVAGQVAALLAQVVPEVEVADEVGVLVGEARVLLLRRLLPVGGPLARVGDRQRGRQHEHLAHAALVLRGQDHPADARVDGQLREAPPDVGQRAVPVEGAELLQQRDAVADAAPVGRVEEREVRDVAELQRGHLQDDAGQVGPQDLGLGVPGPGGEVVLAVEPDRDAVGDASAPAGALCGRGLRDRLDRQPLHLGAPAVARDPRGAGVDDVADAGHGQRCLGDVGGQHDPSPRMRLKDLLLLGRRQPGVQRQDLDILAPQASLVGVAQSGKRVRRVADFPLAGQEDQHVPGCLVLEFPDRVDDGLGRVAGDGADHIVVGVVGVVAGVRLHDLLQRPVADLDWVRAAGHLDDRGAVEMRSEALGLDGRRRDDDLEVGAAGQQLTQVTEQEVDVQAALVRLVDDQRVVAQQQAVALHLGKQDAVGHQLDQRAVTGLVGEADGVADRVAELGVQLVGDALADRARREPARLRVPDGPADPAAQLQTDLGQLGGLAGPRLAGDDHDLVVADRGRDVLAPSTDR